MEHGTYFGVTRQLRFDKRSFFCLLLSLVLNFAYLYGTRGDLTLTGDAIGYDKVGSDLAEGKGFPTTGGYQPKRPPLYLMFVGGIYYVAGHDPQAVRWAQAVIAALFPLLVYGIARELVEAGKLPQPVAVSSAMLTVVYPGFVFYTGVLYREILIVLFILLAMWFLTRYLIAWRRTDAAWFAVLLGLTALIDNRFVYYPILLAVGLALYRKTWKQAVAFLLLVYAVMALVISPWTIRNYVVFGRFVPIATAQDKGLWKSTHPAEFLEWDWSREPLKTYAKMDPEEREKLMAKEAIENLKTYPLTYAKMSVKRFFRLWAGGHSNLVPGLEQSIVQSLQEGRYGIVAIKVFFVVVNMLYLIGGAIGCLLLWRKGGVGPLLHFLVLFGYLSVIHTLVFATPRYHLPLIPAFVIGLAYLVYAWSREGRVKEGLESVGRLSHEH